METGETDDGEASEREDEDVAEEDEVGGEPLGPLGVLPRDGVSAAEQEEEVRNTWSQIHDRFGTHSDDTHAHTHTHTQTHTHTRVYSDAEMTRNTCAHTHAVLHTYVHIHITHHSPDNVYGPQYERRLGDQKHEEELVVLLSDARVQPRTVVVELAHAAPAVLAVLRSHWLL